MKPYRFQHPLVQYGAVERKGVLQKYTGPVSFGFFMMIPGTDIRAESGFLIAFVLTLQARSIDVQRSALSGSSYYI